MQNKRELKNMYTIRNASEADAEAILKIYAPYITDTVVSFETDLPTLEAFTLRVRGILKEYPYLVCEYEGMVVGYAYASRHRERAAYRYSVEASVYVAEGFNKKGIGKALYERLFKELELQGFVMVYAGVTPPNEASFRLHKAFGFTEIGTFHNAGYKFDKWCDVTWFEKQLNAL